MNNPVVLNYAPLLINIPYEQSNLIAAINQIEHNRKISFRIAYSIGNEETGSFELEVKNKESYGEGETPIWSIWDEELNQMRKSLIDTLGRYIEAYFKKLA